MGRPEEEVGLPGGGPDVLLASLNEIRVQFLHSRNIRASDGVAASISVIRHLADTDPDLHSALDVLKAQYLKAGNGRGANGVIASMRALRRWLEQVDIDITEPAPLSSQFGELPP
jgi:hypothetical protein